MRTIKNKKIEKRSKILIVALNIIYNPLKLSCDERTLEIINLAKEYQVPILHVSTRAKLGRAFLGKFGPRVSILTVVYL